MKRITKRILNSFLPILLLLGALFLLLVFAQMQASLDAQKSKVIHITQQGSDSEDNDEDNEYEAEATNFTNNALFNKAKVAFDEGDYNKAKKYYYEILAISPSAEVYNLLGLTLMKQKAFKKALTAYHSALKYDKRYYRAYYNRAYLYSIKKSYAEAISDYKRSITYQPYHFQSHYNLGLAYYKSGNYKLALRSFDKAISLSSGQHKYKALYKKALCYLKDTTPNNSEALATLREAIRIKPDALLARLLLLKLTKSPKEQLLELKTVEKLHPHSILPVVAIGDLLSESNQADKAIAKYKKYLENHTADAKALLFFSRFLYAHAMYDKTIYYLNQAIEIDPQNHEMYYLLGKSLHKLKHYEKAIEQYKKALAFQKNLSNIHLATALSYKQLKNKKAEYLELTLSLRQNRNNSDALYEMAKIALSNKEYNKAKTYIEKSITSDKNRVSAWYLLGEIVSQQDYDDKAIVAYEKALLLNPKYLKAQLALVYARYRVGKFEESIEMCKQIIADDPSVYDAWLYLGKAEYRIKAYQQSQETILEALKLFPQKSDLKKQLALVYLKTNKAEEASTILSELIDENPSNVFTHYSYAKALMQTKDYDKALKALDHVLTLKPTHAPAQKLKKTILNILKEK